MNRNALPRTIIESTITGVTVGVAASMFADHDLAGLPVAALAAVLFVITIARTWIDSAPANHGADTTPGYTITDVFDQVHAMWDERGFTETSIERDPDDYIGRHRMPELAAA